MRPLTGVVAVAVAVNCNFPDVSFATDASMGSDAMMTTPDSGYVVEASVADVMINTEAGCIDRDKDGYYDKFTTCDSGKATDCNDYDPNVNPGITAYNLGVPDSGNLGLTMFPNGDYDCNNNIEYEYGTLTTSQCSGVSLPCPPSGFQAQTECGQLGWFGTCTGAVLCGYHDGGQQPQGCK